MESQLKTYIGKCRSIFSEHFSKFDKIIPLPSTQEIWKSDWCYFERAIKDAENSEEFENFVAALKYGPLALDLERLSKKEEKNREKIKKKRLEVGRQVKFQDIDKWCHDTAHQAAKSFFRNSGVYFKLWHESDLNETNLINILENYTEQNGSEFLRLFVFDGFFIYHDRKRLNNIKLPVGELRTYTENELEVLFRLPQSSWHGVVNPEIIKKASIWHILIVRKKDEYKGMSGIWINNKMVSPINWTEIGEPIKREGNIELIGPIFLCIGEEANLATEIRVKTNIFEYFPVYQKVRNDYLPWDLYNHEEDPSPRYNVKDIGEGGKKLSKIFEIWQKINSLDDNGLLKYQTETYVRSIMNIHSSFDSLMETLVGFVTVIESLLNPGSRSELAYKTAARGAAILAPVPKHRIGLFKILNEFYKIRSQIVHEGHLGKQDLSDLDNMIQYNLTEISRQIFLRYICLVYLGLEGELPSWILSDYNKLLSKEKRSKAIATMLDCLVLNNDVTNIIEEKMKEWGIYENWLDKRRFTYKELFE